ncbi:unannotated protein [freshwater metagenome]|uniref:Unannotated protein n=1 Tax=freshwater metagenome TaxID=449393 RepID=A0A6J7NF61_9ZZZZ
MRAQPTYPRAVERCVLPSRMDIVRRQFLGGVGALGALIAASAVGAGAAQAAVPPASEARKRPSSRNLIRNGSFEKGPLGGPEIDDWVVTVVPA